MLDEYKKKQRLFYDYIMRSVSLGKISHAYLIEANGVSYAKDLAKNLAKYFLNCDNDKSSLVDDGNYPELRIIESDNEIKKESIIDLQNLFSFKPVYGKYFIYIIMDASKLNNSSANTLLKFLEEPNENVIAILLCDNISNVIDTIASRCQIISLASEEKSEEKLLFDVPEGKTLEDFFDFYKNIERYKDHTFAHYDIYKFKMNIDFLLNVGLYFYLDILHVNMGNEKIVFHSNLEYYKEVLLSDKEVLNKIDVITDFIIKNRYNVNKELFLDNFVITLGGIYD